MNDLILEWENINFCQLLCTFLRYLYPRTPSVVMLAHVCQGAGVRISFWHQLPITEIMTWNQIWGRKFVGMVVAPCFKRKTEPVGPVSSQNLSFWRFRFGPLLGQKRLAEFDPQVTKIVDPLKLSPFLSYPTEVFCYPQTCGRTTGFEIFRPKFLNPRLVVL